MALDTAVDVDEQRLPVLDDDERDPDDSGQDLASDDEELDGNVHCYDRDHDLDVVLNPRKTEERERKGR